MQTVTKHFVIAICTHMEKKLSSLLYDTYLLKARFSVNYVAVREAVTSARLEIQKSWRKWEKTGCYAKWIAEG